MEQGSSLGMEWCSALGMGQDSSLGTGSALGGGDSATDAALSGDPLRGWGCGGDTPSQGL